ncbi:MAG: hypothetical protein ACQEWU_05295 [Bacillota bacterium]
MAKKKYYDEHGNQIRSRPPKRVYQKWWIWLMAVVVVTVGITVLGGKENTEEPVTKEISGVEKKEEEETKVAEPEEEGTSEESTYTYEDFKGIYVTFEGEPYESPVGVLLALNDDQIITRHPWGASSSLDKKIMQQSIEGDVLILDWNNPYREGENGVTQYEIYYQDNKKIIRDINTQDTFYPMSNQDLQHHYNQSEIDYARIILTINGEISLNQWIVSAESGAPVVNVRYNSAGDPTEVSNEVSYPEDVTHLDLTSQGMAFGIITYSSHGDGHITRYPMPLHYHQEDQSEEGYRQLAQEALDDADTIYVEPFEPYLVADFIGRVEFVYE